MLLDSFSYQAADDWLFPSVQHDLYDALFYVRMVVAIVLGVAYGAVGAQGLLAFLS